MPPKGTLPVSVARPEPTRAHHAQVAEREVVSHRIDRIERAQGGGNVGGHLPARRNPARQPETLPHPNRVRVERDHQLTGLERAPATRIHGVGPDHPAEEQVEALAGAA
jgi:hypothetical protein